MRPPMVSVVTFNRLGLTIRNINSLLNTTDDFELHILDSGSIDNTWEYLQSLHDPRIKQKERMEQNSGPIYAVNYNLAKRKDNQYFITLDSDVHLYSRDWISRFMRVFNEFPDVGLLGLPNAKPYPEYIPEVITMEKNGISYKRLKTEKPGAIRDFIPGHCQCLRPELLKVIGYWSEESHFGDAELSFRVTRYTSYAAGLVTDIEIDMEQSISCSKCPGHKWCKKDLFSDTCFTLRNKLYKNSAFVNVFGWKHKAFLQELEEGKRTVFCASIHDPDSIKNHFYHTDWAKENFEFYRGGL